MTKLPPSAPRAYYRSQLSDATLAWCRARWPHFADARRAQRACEAYERPTQIVERLRRIVA